MATMAGESAKLPQVSEHLLILVVPMITIPRSVIAEGVNFTSTAPPTGTPAGWYLVRQRLLSALFLLASTAFVYWRMFSLFGVPYLHVGDFEDWALDGMRMLDGQVMYRDFQNFTFP